MLMTFMAISKQNIPSTSEMLVQMGIVMLSGSNPLRQDTKATPMDMNVTISVSNTIAITQIAINDHMEIVLTPALSAMV